MKKITVALLDYRVVPKAGLDMYLSVISMFHFFFISKVKNGFLS